MGLAGPIKSIIAPSYCVMRLL